MITLISAYGWIVVIAIAAGIATKVYLFIRARQRTVKR